MILPHKLAPFSREQYDFLVNSTARINIAHGPVRSGKNFIENVRLLKYLVSEPFGDPRSPIAFCGASINAILDIFLSDLFDMVGPKNFTYDASKGRGTLYGRPFQCYPCQRAGDYKRLRGKTLGGALITEGTLCDKEFLNEMLARLSIEGAKLFIDTNPSGPFHWLYTDYITHEEMLRTGTVRAFGFNFDSNLSLSQEYKDYLKESYGPGSLWYRRMILGEWCMADGVIYAGFTKDRNTCDPARLPRKFDQALNIGVDYGTSNPFAGMIGGQKDGVWYITREYYYDGRDQGQKADSFYAESLADFITEPLRFLYLDPSAASMKTEFRQNARFRRTGIKVKDADNSVLEGIATLNNLLTAGRLVFSTDCANALREIGSYIWDPNAQKRGEDKPKKENDHTLDACRYLIHSQVGKASSFVRKRP
jgi:PBSX family phage terminase large subunit